MSFWDAVLKAIKDIGCCLIGKGTAENPLVVQPTAAEPGVFTQPRLMTVNPTTGASVSGSWTSYEVENLHPTHWLLVEGMTTLGNGTAGTFVVPPKSSKVIALSSGAINQLPYTFTFYPTSDWGGTPVDAGSFDGTERIQTTAITSG